MLELRLGSIASFFQVGDNPPLTLEMRESAHAVLARAIIERIRFRLEIIDLALNGLRRVTRIPQIELRKCSRDLHCFSIHGVRGFTDVGNYLSLALRHSHDLPLNLVAVGSDLSQSGAVRRVVGRQRNRRSLSGQRRASHSSRSELRHCRITRIENSSPSCFRAFSCARADLLALCLIE